MARSPWCDDVCLNLFSRKSTQTVEGSPTLSLLRTPKKIKKVIGLRPPVPARSGPVPLVLRHDLRWPSSGSGRTSWSAGRQSHQGFLHHVGLKGPGPTIPSFEMDRTKDHFEPEK